MNCGRRLGGGAISSLEPPRQVQSPGRWPRDYGLKRGRAPRHMAIRGHERRRKNLVLLTSKNLEAGRDIFRDRCATCDGKA